MPVLASHAAEKVALTDLDLSVIRQGWGKPQLNRSIREKPLSIAGQTFAQGIGTHAKSVWWIDLGGGSEQFHAFAGLDDAAGGGSITFKIVGDGRTLWESGVMKSGDKARDVNVDLKGIKTLLLMVGDAGDGVAYDHADWADAQFTVTGQKPKSISAPPEPAIILTPKPGPQPRINGPDVYGAHPGHPFIYRIPTQGQRPITFSAEELPAGLRLDSTSGIITGTVPAKGEYAIKFTAKNSFGSATRVLKLVSGDTLALTPPMGWNHWYTHYDRITDKLMRDAADVMVNSGMADVGYQFVNIDDCWMNAPQNNDPLRVGPLRDEHGNVIPNKHFPDMKELTDYIHAKGLRAGIYTSPGPLTCGGFCGAWQHEAQDAKQFADWGFDFLKYDWCSYGEVVKGDNSLATLKKPYQLMGDWLKAQNRDMVFNLCQYGMGNVWEWGADVGGHCWRTAGDLGFELTGFFDVALRNAEHRANSKPGSWNDPDYIQIGMIGAANNMGQPSPCPLSPNQQYAFMSLWSLMAAPLFFSGDMNHLDDFTVNVLCNPEVIAVDQDTLGQSAKVTRLTDETFVMFKELADGSKAVGLCNRGEFETKVSVTWDALGIKNRQAVRDLWRQKDLGTFDRQYTATVPAQGVVLVRIKESR